MRRLYYIWWRHEKTGHTGDSRPLFRSEEAAQEIVEELPAGFRYRVLAMRVGGGHWPRRRYDDLEDVLESMRWWIRYHKIDEEIAVSENDKEVSRQELLRRVQRLANQNSRLQAENRALQKKQRELVENAACLAQTVEKLQGQVERRVVLIDDLLNEAGKEHVSLYARMVKKVAAVVEAEA